MKIPSLRRFIALSALAASLSGCLRSTEAQPSLLQLDGSWTYTGVQTAPVPENLTGTLVISGGSGASFQGTLALVGRNPQTNQQRSLTGFVSGVSRSSNVVDFDFDVETVSRRHVGEIVADTIKGTWVGSADGTSGTFRAEREAR
ncbi:MAG TPA: hypothetical protein VM166_09725 [Gemmatimonadaceae bacterium]|nr:hypothetical protein [Gemmatimonadaceae bacterium]